MCQHLACLPLSMHRACPSDRGWNRVTRPWTPSRCMVESLDSIGKRAEQPKTESDGIDEPQATGRDLLVARAKRGPPPWPRGRHYPRHVWTTRSEQAGFLRVRCFRPRRRWWATCYRQTFCGPPSCGRCPRFPGLPHSARRIVAFRSAALLAGVTGRLIEQCFPKGKPLFGMGTVKAAPGRAGTARLL